MMASREWGKWQMLRRQKGREGRSSRWVGFNDYSLLVANQSWWGRVMRNVVCSVARYMGMMLSLRRATQSNQFNFSPHGETWHVSCFILILQCLDISWSFSIHYLHWCILCLPAKVDINAAGQFQTIRGLILTYLWQPVTSLSFARYGDKTINKGDGATEEK